MVVFEIDWYIVAGMFTTFFPAGLVWALLELDYHLYIKNG